MASLALKQSEVKELLDTIVTVVEERRINAGQAFELAKRNLQDADNSFDRDKFGKLMDFQQVLENRYLSLAAEINDVIKDAVGADWRS